MPVLWVETDNGFEADCRAWSEGFKHRITREPEAKRDTDCDRAFRGWSLATSDPELRGEDADGRDTGTARYRSLGAAMRAAVWIEMGHRDEAASQNADASEAG